jgi:hypothetical protein
MNFKAKQHLASLQLGSNQQIAESGGIRRPERKKILYGNRNLIQQQGLLIPWKSFVR